MSNPLILVTAASGQLGRLAVDALRRKSGLRVAAMVRRSDAADTFAAQDVEVRQGDYTDPASLDRAFAGVDRLLFISSNAIGARVPQHANVITAAQKAGVPFVAYTSVLHADTSPLGLAEEHRQTEDLLRRSGLRSTMLRNGWYTENYTIGVPAALEHGVFLSCAGEGRIASASRADYADAAAAILSAPPEQAEPVYELAGDRSYTLADMAETITRLSGKTVPYKSLPQAEYEAVLLGAGLPPAMAALIADSNAAAATGALDDSSGTLGRVIGRPTTPMPDTVAAAIAALK